MEKLRILVVDDEQTLLQVLRFNLEQHGYEVDVAESAEEAMRFPIGSYSLILLDVMLGGMNGFTFAQRIKENPQTMHVPIIFCTAKDSENDTVAGLTIGADDYISKPFSVRELLARVKTVLRRTRQNVAIHPLPLSFMGLKVDRESKFCSVDGVPIELTRKELDLLVLLLGHPGQIFTREVILSRIWPNDVVVVERTVDVTVTRLRKKIGGYGNCIITRHGYGYGFQQQV